MRGFTDLFRFLTERRHSRLRELLSSYIDGEVTDAERARVEEHLATCDACREELESLRWTVSVLAEMPEVQTSRSFVFSTPPDRDVRAPAASHRHPVGGVRGRGAARRACAQRSGRQAGRV